MSAEHDHSSHGKILLLDGEPERIVPADLEMAWGGNGLAEITAIRTYSRVRADGSRETWADVIDRVVRGTREIGARLTSAEEDVLIGAMSHLKGSVSGRALWQLGTPLVGRYGQDSLNNCLAGETEVITDRGIVPIRDLAGGEHTLMTDYGKWVKVPVRSFGVQALCQIALRRGRTTKVIRATADHGWFIVDAADASGERRVLTADLRPNDRLVSVHGENSGTERGGDWVVEAVRETGVSEEVFCAVVPETHSFVLADNIKTSNCYYVTVETPDDFVWLMDRLMVGGGVGFSVERANVYQLPVIKGATVTHQPTNDADYIVPDTRQGWSELVRRTLVAYFEGHSFTYSTVVIRPAGAPLRTFGGTASGPIALIEGIADICGVLEARVGKRLRSTDVLDIANIIGRVVVAGSARRSAQIAIGDPDDLLFLKAKRWASGNIPNWRAQSNNTVIADGYDEIPDQFWHNFDGGSEPYGLFNRKLARTYGRVGEKRPDAGIMGVNPCAEIPLANRESCNLSTIFLPNLSSFDEFVAVSTVLYKIQKAISLLKHPDAKSQAIIHRNMRLGQSLSGILQGTDEQRSWVGPAYERLRATDAEWSKELGVRESIKLTTVQPSGTLGLVGSVTPGIHGAYARHYIRRVRFGSNDPLVEICRERGYPVMYDVGFDGREERSRIVVEFPAQAPEGTPLASHMSAIDQLEWVTWAQRHWADNAVSVTVTYRDEEMSGIRAWLAEHYDKELKSVSFLRYSDHGFALAPYEPIEEAEYERRVARLKHLDEPVVIRGESALDDAECATGACPVR